MYGTVKTPPAIKPTTGRAAAMTDDEYAAWREEQTTGALSVLGYAAGTAFHLAANPHLIDVFRLYAAQFSHYNLRNKLRLFGQDPRATRVQGDKWWLREGRQVVEGAAPLWVDALYTGKRTKEVTDKRTGETEQVEAQYRAVVPQQVYDITQTVPVPDTKGRGCMVCTTPAGEPCPPYCGIYLSERGRIPSRMQVLLEIFDVLKEYGGVDVEGTLAQLGPDAYEEGDQVDGTTLELIKVTMSNGRKTTRRVHVTGPDDKGRIRYAVLKVGVFWISLDELAYDQNRRGTSVRVQYGDDPEPGDEHRWAMNHGEKARPYAPVINGVTLAGYGVANADEADDPGFWVSVGRPGRYGTGRVPDKTEKAARQIVAQLVKLWRERPDLDKVRAAHDRFHAPHRLANHEHEAEKMRALAEEYGAKLLDAQEKAAAQRALLAAEKAAEDDENAAAAV
ncbi:hypothetical protein ACIBH1_45630 [Nonomuraea sp. NPDC050663]|uniref:hypothetical protein n=1 Tax=Nonomuraea sp. NPDC050663 TaxID=3364370 RepID=UPI0037AE3237